MASRVGTYLSDESIRKMCPLEHMPPGSKTYELFKIASAPDKLAQRPQDPKEALRAIATLQNQSYQDLEKRYIESLSIIKPELIGVIPSVARPNQASSIQASVSRPTLVPMGTSAPAPIPVIGKPTLPRFLKDYGKMNPQEQVNIYKAVVGQLKSANIKVPFTKSMIDNLSNETRKNMMINLYNEIQSIDPTNTIIEDTLGVGGSGAGSSSSMPPPPNE